MAAATPTREDIKSAYQSALQGAAPPAASAAESVAPSVPVRHLDPGEIASALTRGTALIASGDLAAARLVLRRAADAGDARSAMALAETYDPAILEKLGVHGVVPNLAKARDWYEKARQFGATEANQRLEVLASKQY
jgi:TPR repeat protein